MVNYYRVSTKRHQNNQNGALCNTIVLAWNYLSNRWFLGLNQIKRILSSTQIHPPSRAVVSVLLHAYKPDWFAEALQSVLDQTYPGKSSLRWQHWGNQSHRRSIGSRRSGIRHFLHVLPFEVGVRKSVLASNRQRETLSNTCAMMMFYYPPASKRWWTF